MKIVVVGAGGLGGYFGARLAADGNDVTFIARGKHLEAMLRDGLRVQNDASPLLVRPVRATDRAERVGHVDLVIVAVKLWDTEIAAESVRPAIGPQTAVVSFQNGVDAAERIAGVLGHEHVLGGVGYVAATIEAPGVIRHTGTMQRLSLRRAERDALATCRCIRRCVRACGNRLRGEFRHPPRHLGEVRLHRRPERGDFSLPLQHRSDPRACAQPQLVARDHA